MIAELPLLFQAVSYASCVGVHSGERDRNGRELREGDGSLQFRTARGCETRLLRGGERETSADLSGDLSL